MKTKEYTLQHPLIHNRLVSYMQLAGMDNSLKPSKGFSRPLQFKNLYLNEDPHIHTVHSPKKNSYSIFVGTEHPMFVNDDLNENFNLVKTAIIREIGKIRCISKKEWTEFVYKFARTAPLLGNYFRDIFYILEESRTNKIMSAIYPHFEKTLLIVNQRRVKELEEHANDYIDYEGLDIVAKLKIILSAIAFMSGIKMIPGTKHADINGLLPLLYPYVLVARESNSTAEVAQCVEKIISCMEDFVNEYKENVDTKLKSYFVIRDIGTDRAASLTTVFQGKETFEIPTLSKKAEKLVAEVIDVTKKEFEEDEETTEEKTEETDEVETFTTSMSPHTDVTVPSEEDDEETDEEEPEDEDDEVEDEDEETDEEDEEDEDEEEDELNPEDLEKSKQDTKNAVHRKRGEANITANLNHPELFFSRKKLSVDKSFIEQVKFAEKELQAPVVDKLITSYTKSVKQDHYQATRESQDQAKIEKLSKKITTPIHKGYYSVFRQRKELEQFKPEEYQTLIKNDVIRSVIKQTLQEFEELKQNKVEDFNRFQRTGSIDSRGLVNFLSFKDPNIFRQKFVDPKELEMEMMLLVDVSGSNNAMVRNEKNNTVMARYQLNQMVAIMLHEIFKELHFKHSIWTFYEEFMAQRQVFGNLVDRSNCFQKDSGLALRHIDAFDSNRDGYAIRVAGNYINSLKENPKRLLIVLSDGQPAASGGYGGEPAARDVFDAVKEVEKDGTKVIGIFTGHESENDFFNKMYPNAIFCNNENIYDLPKMLKKLLIQEFKDQLEAL